eukprot:scaffold36887_cov167-Skeletonema_dohrnii-CCMP3373.AAC.1
MIPSASRRKRKDLKSGKSIVRNWWFTYKCYMLHGIDINGGMYANATLALIVFSVLGTISYLAELYQTVFRHTEPLK